MESGKIQWDLAPVTIAEVVSRSVTTARSLVEHKGLSLSVDISPGLPSFLGDHDRLIQVMLNLISNAVKFTPSGGITIKAFIEGEMIRVGVIDTGPGISQKDQEIIFEKFKQAGDTLTEKPKGTGLGLPICRQIVDRHGGRIWVESTPGQGSSFWFTLPVRGAAREAEAASGPLPASRDRLQPLPAGTGQGTILVVDDEPPVRLYLEQLLADEGFRVFSAADGPQAIDLAVTHRPDLITMDLMMPGMDGATTIRHLRANPATKDIPVVGAVGSLLTYEDMPEEVIYKITKMIHGYTKFLQERLNYFNSLTLDFALAGMSVPLHPGAKKFYVEAGLIKE
jgi:CheY-like chemotaxis protein